MLVFRHWITVSAGAVIVLGYGASTAAQDLLAGSQSDRTSPSAASLAPIAADQNTSSTATNLQSQLSRTVKAGTEMPVQGGAIEDAESLRQVLRQLDANRDKPASTSPPARKPPLKGQEMAQSKPPQSSQPAPSSKENPAPSPSTYVRPPAYVNPSANPLLFPTKPSEVKIDKVVPITLNQAIELALRNNQPLQTARLTLEKSRSALRAAQADLYPTLDGVVDFARTDDAITKAQISNQKAVSHGLSNPAVNSESNAFTGRVELNYNLYTGGRTSSQIRLAERQVRFDELQVEVTAEDTRFNATNDYYALQTADASVAINQARVEDANQTLRDAQLLEQAGLGTKFDVLQAEVQVANASQALTRSIADQRTARRKLAQTLNVGQQIDLTAADEIKAAGSWSYSLDDTIVLAYKNRGELEQKLVQAEINEQQRQIALAAIKPQVQLFANYNLYDNFNDQAPLQTGYTVGTRLTWTFFDGGKAQAQAEQANRDIDINQTAFSQQRDEIRFNVEKAYNDLIANQQNIKTTQQAVITATESLRLARLRFQAGVGTQTDVIQSQTALTTARGDYLRAITDYNTALNSLQRQVSNLPENRLFQFR